MSDMNNRLREIFDQRRRKQNNWPRLIIMVIILIAIIVGISMLNKAAEKAGCSPAQCIKTAQPCRIQRRQMPYR